MNRTVKDIKKYLENIPIENILTELEKFETDQRESIKKLIISYEKKYNKYEKELQRMKNIISFENYYFNKDLNFIGGMDEVGRGPLAGPVVACCVIFPKDFLMNENYIKKLWGINDSKKLSEESRKKFYNIILEEAEDIGIGMIFPEVIDKINILQGTYRAMEIAVDNLKIKPEIILNDAVRVPFINILQHPIIQGDSKSISISAGSIVAKVTRDELMKQYDKIYPEYDFVNNKGYGTEKHLEAIKKNGLTNIHRKTFSEKFL